MAPTTVRRRSISLTPPDHRTECEDAVPLFGEIEVDESYFGGRVLRLGPIGK